MTQVAIGQINNNSQVNVLEINYPSMDTEFKTIDLVELPDLGLSCLILNNEEAMNSIAADIEKYQHLFPVVNAEDFNIKEDIKEYASTEMVGLVENITSKWIMHNNLVSIEEIFPLKEHLANLFNSDRNTFFEELWYFLKRNLGTSELTIIFNDVLEPEDEKKGDRPKLIQSYIKGSKRPDFHQGGAKEEKVMEHFSTSCTEAFEISDFNDEKKQLTILANIKGIPIVIMAETMGINQLQESLFKAIFNGLQL